MNKAFGVQVTIQNKDGGKPLVQPLVVVAGDERDAELLAASRAAESDVETIRELTIDEVEEYGLDLARHGDMKALPALNL